MLSKYLVNSWHKICMSLNKKEVQHRFKTLLKKQALSTELAVLKYWKVLQCNWCLNYTLISLPADLHPEYSSLPSPHPASPPHYPVAATPLPRLAKFTLYNNIGAMSTSKSPLITARWSNISKEYFVGNIIRGSASHLNHTSSLQKSSPCHFSVHREEVSLKMMLPSRKPREQLWTPFLHQTLGLVFASPGKTSSEMFYHTSVVFFCFCFCCCFKWVNSIFYHIWLNLVM